MSVREYRLSIGTDIIKAMEDNGEFPIQSAASLTDRMMEYFYELGYEDELEEIGSRWEPTQDYWRHNMKAIRAELRKEKLYFEFIENGQGFRGEWKFTDKPEYHDKLVREGAGLDTRIESYNERVNDGGERWKLDLPLAQQIPALPPYMGR